MAKAKEPPGATPTDVGNVDAAMGQAAKVVEATYSVPYSPRARLEPGRRHRASHRRPGGCLDRRSGSTRSPPGCGQGHWHLARECVCPFDIPGWGLRRRRKWFPGSAGGLLAKTVKGRPVKLLWTREEDMTTGKRYRPMSVCLMRAGLDADGWPIAMEVRHSTEWGARIWFRLTASTTLFYAELPHHRSLSDDPRSDWESPFERASSRTSSTWNVSLMSSRMPPARIRTSTGAS